MATKTFPYKIDLLEESLMEKMKIRFLAYTGGLVKVEGNDYVMPAHYAKYAHKYYNYKFLPDDVLIMTHPKCGTTWSQEIIWTMRSGCQFDTELELGVRSPFFEFDSIEAPTLKPLDEWIEGFKSRNPGKDPEEEGLYLEMTNSTPSPRTIKTHLTFSLLPPSLLDTNKVVYVARNPKDTAVSYFHHQRLVKVSEFQGDFPEFFDYFTRDLLIQGPFWKHVEEAWEKRHHPNLLFLFYEDMKEDPLREFQRINSFLGTELTQDQLQQVVHHTSFKNMKSKPQTNPTQAAIKVGRFNDGEGEFVRKGIAGDWVNYFTPALEEKFKEWMSRWSHISDRVPVKYNV